MRKRVIVAAGVASSFVGLAQRAQATPVTVPNFSFELDSSGNQITSWGAFNLASPNIQAWTFSTTANFNTGDFNGGTTPYPSPDQPTAVYLHGSDTMQQILPISSGVVTPGATYTLTAELTPNYQTLGVTMSLFAYNAATQTVSGPIATANQVPDSTLDKSATGTVPLASPLSGQQLLIRFVGIGTQAQDAYTNLDNVRLAATPEPASLSVFAVASLGLLARRRRA